ncbi:MAG: Isoquinoline 1-oxidoreductase subunit [Pseudomonadota bacterium]
MSLFRNGVMALAAGALAAGVLAFAEPGFRGEADAATEPAINSVKLKPVSSFEKIKNKNQRSVALFEEAGKVIMSPRCMNCHPATERPTQTNKMTPHQPLVVRGQGGMGAAGGLACNTCHHEANFDPAGVPGHPKWHLAPAEMAWQGKTLGQICEQIKDPKRNDGMDMAALVKHMAEDSLVGWAWSPGAGRTPAPGTQKEFGDLIKAWAAAGGACPKIPTSTKG